VTVVDRQPIRTSSKAKMLAAMEGAGVTEFPVVLPYMGILLRDHWDEVTDVPWWTRASGDIEANLRVARDLQAELSVDWVPAQRSRSREWRARHEVRMRGDRPFLVDRLTGTENEIVREPPGGIQVPRTENRVHSIDDIDRLVPLCPAQQIVEGGSLDYAAAVIEEFGDEHFIVSSIDAPFWRMNGYFGLHDMMTSLIEHPDRAEHLLERVTVASLEELKAYSEIGIDGVWVECAYSSADMISLEHFRRFAAPYLERQIRLINELGMKSICYYCGDASDRLEHLVEMGPTCIALEETNPKYVNEIDEIDRVIDGRVCLFGNVDSIGVLQNGSREEMAAEIERQLDVGRRKGRFVMSLGSPVTPSTPLAKVAEFVGLARERSAAV